MDFMKWLNSLDELLYEVMSWLLFFPLTLWRAIVSPIETMRVVEQQVALPEDRQFAALLSPPIFMSLGLLLAHAVAMAMGQVDEIVADQNGLAALVSDSASALILRVVVFASFPLFLAARLVRRSGLALDRVTLRLPFYEQCYPGAVFAIGVSIGTTLANNDAFWGRAIGWTLVGLTIVYFFAVETSWFAARSKDGYLRSASSVLVGFGEGLLFFLFVGFIFTR